MATLGQAYANTDRHAPGYDTLRIVAASAVVVHHCAALQFDIVRDDLLFRISSEYTTMGFLAVCVFFCVSGFLVMPGLVKTGDVIGYLSRRFMRIMPLLTIVVLGTVFLLGPMVTSLTLREYFSDGQTWLYLKNITTSLSLELPGTVNQTGGNSVNSALWTLRYEWLCYLLLAALAAIGLLKFRLVLLALWLSAIGLTLITYGGQTQTYSQIETAAHLFAYFGAGSLLYLYRHELPYSAALVGVSIVVMVASWISGLGVLFAPLATAYAVAGLGLVNWPWSEWTAKADPSYGIYLLHGPVIVAVVALAAPTSAVGLFAWTMPVTLGLALLSWYALEAPALRHKTLPADVFYKVMGRFGWHRRGLS